MQSYPFDHTRQVLFIRCMTMVHSRTLTLFCVLFKTKCQMHWNVQIPKPLFFSTRLRSISVSLTLTRINRLSVCVFIFSTSVCPIERPYIHAKIPSTASRMHIPANDTLMTCWLAHKPNDVQRRSVWTHSIGYIVILTFYIVNAVAYTNTINWCSHSMALS